jgi:hypothetical protein
LSLTGQKRTLAVVLLVDATLTAPFLLRRPLVEMALDTRQAEHLGGFAYVLDLPRLVAFPLELPHDGFPYWRSPLRLLENGRPLERAHAVQREIMERGGGRYSHWASPSDILIFSSSDGSDPRTNGRAYAIRGRPTVDHRLAVGALLLLMLQLPLAIAWIGEWARRRSPQLVCVAPVVTFVLVAVVFQVLGLRHARPRVLSMGDPGMVAGMIAAAQHPDRFASDHALGTGSSVEFYATVLRPVVSLLDHLVADFGTAYILTYGPLVFLQLLGFYLLGRVLLASRLHAVLLALLTLAPVYTSGGDLWGIADEPLTRMLYGAALPYVLAAGLVLYDRRFGWLVVPVLLAATVYLHPVSQPSVAASCLLAAAATTPGRPTIARVARALVAGLVLAAAMLPYAVTYFSAGVAGMGAVLGSAVADHLQFLSAYFGPQYFDVRVALRMLLDGGTGSGQGPWGWRWLVWCGGLTSLALLSASRGAARRPARFLLCFLLGILMTSAGLAAVDERVAASHDRLPVLIDIIRNVRFTIPILLIGVVMGLDALAVRPSGGRVATACLMALSATWWHWQPPLPMKWLQGRLSPQDPAVDDALPRILAIARGLPPGSLFLPIGDEQAGLALRYAALQPVAFLVKDLNFLLYSGRGEVGLWLETDERLRKLLSADDPQTAGTALRELIDSTRARYLLVASHSLPRATELAIAEAGPLVAARGSWRIVEPRERAPSEPPVR